MDLLAFHLKLHFPNEVHMGLGKQAKILSNAQVATTLRYLETKRNADRNHVILLLSVKAGLRAKEISELTWSSVLTAGGELGDIIELTDQTSKGKSGRVIPINRDLKKALHAWKEIYQKRTIRSGSRPFPERRIICTERSDSTPAQVIVNLFHHWFRELGFVGASSHSGRRTFITNAAKKVVQVGGSLRDVQELAGHSSLSMTQRYIEGDSKAKRRLVQLL